MNAKLAASIPYSLLTIPCSYALAAPALPARLRQRAQTRRREPLAPARALAQAQPRSR